MVFSSVSSKLVNVAEDAELRLVRLLADTAPVPVGPTFVQDCEASIDAADAAGLMRTIVQETGAIAAFLQIESADEAVSAFSLLAALLERVGSTKADDKNSSTALSQSLATAILNGQLVGKSEADLALRRITLLSALYNVRADGKEKCSLVNKMIRLAAANQPKMLSEDQALGKMLLEDDVSTTMVALSASVPRIVSMLNAWDVPLSDRRELYHTIADAFPELHPRKQRFKLLLVETYADASQIDEAGFKAAKEAAIGAIRNPVTLFVHQRNMLSLPAVQELAKNKEAKPLHGLLSVFQEKKLEDYDAFAKANGGEEKLLEPWGLSVEQCRRHMRILSLCSLAAEHEEIPYQVVAKTLQLPSDDQVESWVIAAASSGLLAAKMDQLQQKIIVERSVVRRFDMEQWKVLQARLNVWKENVGAILQAFKQSQAGALSQHPI